MNAARRAPIWLWWIIGGVMIIAIAAGAVMFVRSVRPSMPPGLAEKRSEVARILDESGRIADVDIRPLAELESKKNYRGAVTLMEQALAANSAKATASASLLGVSSELVKLAIQVRPDIVGAKAVEAFGFLAQLAGAEKKFYEDRRLLYEMTRDYYAGLAAKKAVPIPENMLAAVDMVNSDLEKTRELNAKFNAAVKEFDALAARR